MGVSGSGKSLIGKKLGKELNIPFFDGDDYHSFKNKIKMQLGLPLSDKDRTPWLKTLANLLKTEPSIILACSALKKKYQDILKISSDTHIIYLRGSFDLIKTRLKKRKGHFFNPSLLKSQFNILEEPEKAIIINIASSPEDIVSEICSKLK